MFCRKGTRRKNTRMSEFRRCFFSLSALSFSRGRVRKAYGLIICERTRGTKRQAGIRAIRPLLKNSGTLIASSGHDLNHFVCTNRGNRRTIAVRTYLYVHDRRCHVSLRGNVDKQCAYQRTLSACTYALVCVGVRRL